MDKIWHGNHGRHWSLWWGWEKMTTLNRQTQTQRKHKQIIGIKFVHLI